MAVTQFTKDIVARLKKAGFTINRIWLPPSDNPEGQITITVANRPHEIAVQIDESIPEAFVLRYLNERSNYYYPPRCFIDDVMADVRAAKEGKLYAE